MKPRPDRNGTERKGNLREGKRTISLCLFINVMTKELVPSKTTHQNTTNQPDVIKLKALRISVIIVTDTPPRMAINKKHSRKDTDQKFVFEGAQVRFISSDS